MVETRYVQKVHLYIQDGAGGSPSQQVFYGPIIQVGRGAGNHLSFADRRVSSIHGRFLIENDSVLYQDLGSTNGSGVWRGGKRMAASDAENRGIALQPGDEIQLGDAEYPSSIRLEEITWASESPAREATVVARRALGEVAGLPEAETLHRLLQLLAELRTESDTFSVTRKVLQFLLDTLPETHRAECFMKDTTGHFGPVLAVGSEDGSPVAIPPSSSLMSRLMNTQEVVMVHDTQKAPDPSASILSMPSRALLLAPLVCEHEVVGAIQVGSRQGGIFGDRDLDLVAVLAQQLSAVLSGARLIRRLQEAEERLRSHCDYLKERLGQRPALEEMVGSGPAMQEIRRQLAAVAPSRTTVLIQGETGVGKELVARAIHEHSPRRDAAFAAINCSALSPGVLESELFGHMRGAFTGAHQDHQGLFEVAHQGTLFLDEIGDLPLGLQPKLLRCLEEGTILPVGSTKPRKVDVRVVAASNRELEQEVKAGRFRQDLLFRLNVFPLYLPPLRKRREDILPLAKHFLTQFCREHGRERLDLAADSIAALEGYAFPGNIRELKNEMERASLLAPPGGQVERIHLSERLGGGQALVGPVEGTLKEIIERLEKVVLQAALKRHGGNRTQCARTLGISRQALIAKIARLELGE